MDKVMMTKKEYDNNVAKLGELKDKLPGAADMLKEARSHGDLSENSEFDAAREYLLNLEAEIETLEAGINNAEIINEAELTTEVVKGGHKVKVKDTDSKKEMTFVIVGKTESDPFCVPAKVSNESPVGMGLLGHGVGDKVEIFVPGGARHFKILAINKREE